MGGIADRVFLSLPHQLTRSELVAVRLSLVKTGLKEQGYECASIEGSIGLNNIDTLAVLRLGLLVSCQAVWFPKDFERSALSVGEYNYAYALDKRIIVDGSRRLLD